MNKKNIVGTFCTNIYNCRTSSEIYWCYPHNLTYGCIPHGYRSCQICRSDLIFDNLQKSFLIDSCPVCQWIHYFVDTKKYLKKDYELTRANIIDEKYHLCIESVQTDGFCPLCGVERISVINKKPDSSSGKEQGTISKSQVQINHEKSYEYAQILHLFLAKISNEVCKQYLFELVLTLGCDKFSETLNSLLGSLLENGDKKWILLKKAWGIETQLNMNFLNKEYRNLCGRTDVKFEKGNFYNCGCTSKK